ncbi:MAG TPA: sigma-70 family RNA polymerase sigma factor [Terracidiphilus sp.]|nr:sigma-70 family RNA polymerase sigma factor [Terracidiphilus sp.]
MPDTKEPAEVRGSIAYSPTGNAEAQPVQESCTTPDLALFAHMSSERRAQLLWDVQRVTRSSEDAEDIVQEGLLRAWRNLQQFRGDSQISTWLRAIVRNTAREWLRNRGSRVHISIGALKTEDDEQAPLELTDTRPGPEETCARREMEELLHAEIEALTMVSRTAIELCALQEQSLRDAARALNVNVITVKSRLFRSRQLLHRGLCHRTGGREHCYVP